MRFEKSPDSLVTRFHALLPKHPAAEAKQMFGYPCAFVHGNYWVGLHEANVAVRLPDGLEKKFPAMKGAKTFDPMGDRPMKGWFVVPPAVVQSDAKFSALLEGTLAAVLELPPKASKRPTAKKPPR